MDGNQLSSITQSCPTLWDTMDCSMPGLPVHHQPLEFTQTHIHWVSDAIQPSHPLLFHSPPAFKLSQHQGLFNKLVHHIRWPKYWSFSFSISPSNEYSGLISFKMEYLDLLAVQGTCLKSLLQHHSSEASVLQCSAFFIVQPSHPYMTTGKTIALTWQTIVGKVMSLLFNMLCRLLITFLPRSKHLLISWLLSPSAVILEPPKIVSHCFSIYLTWRDGTECLTLSLVFWKLNFKPKFLLSSFTFIKRLFLSSSLSAIRVVSFAYLWLLIFLLAILIPACASYSPAFLMMYSAYKLNKQGDNI